MKINKRHLLAGLAVWGVLCLTAANANAQPKPWGWSWWESHWVDQTFVPYIENGKDPHNSQWHTSRWHPDDWIAQREDSPEMIRSLYLSDIIRRQYVRKDIPAVQIGPNFYRLGGQDKRRVMATIDHIYNVTAASEHGMFMIYDWRTNRAIGSYTKHGLQIQ